MNDDIYVSESNSHNNCCCDMFFGNNDRTFHTKQIVDHYDMQVDYLDDEIKIKMINTCTGDIYYASVDKNIKKILAKSLLNYALDEMKMDINVIEDFDDRNHISLKITNNITVILEKKGCEDHKTQFTKMIDSFEVSSTYLDTSIIIFMTNTFTYINYMIVMTDENVISVTKLYKTIKELERDLPRLIDNDFDDENVRIDMNANNTVTIKFKKFNITLNEYGKSDPYIKRIMENANARVTSLQDNITQLEDNIKVIKSFHNDVGQDVKNLFDKCAKYKLL